MTAVPHDPALDDIRRAIDVIDDRILELIGERIAASARVRQVKNRAPAAFSPIRPAREAAILRRLMARKPASADPEFLVRLWRVILTSSTLAQAPVTVHMTRSIASTPRLRAMVADHFCAMPVAEHDSIKGIIDHLAGQQADIAVTAPDDGWVSGVANGLQVMGRLPVLTSSAIPQLLVIGHCEPQATGNDETVLAGLAGERPEPGHPVLWQTESAGRPVAGVRGFLTKAPNSSLTVAGRYPRPIEA